MSPKQFFILIALCFHTTETFAKRNPKIIGGDIINIEQAPYNVALEYLTRQICGGAILAPQWVVTAAHCFGVVFLKSQAQVRADASTRLRGGTLHAVREVLKHPGFEKTININDVALIMVSPPVTYSATAAPISLPDYFTKPGVGELMTAYGWGYTVESGSPSEYLRAVTLPVFSHDECQQVYNTTLNVTSEMLCAGYRNGGRDACVLDSGGPLVWRGTLRGLVSWGWGCARALRPGVFTDVSALQVNAWLKTNIQR